MLVSIDAEQLAAALQPDGTGFGTFVWSGQPVTSRELGHLLDDCSFVGVFQDADRTPIEVTSQVRTVPVGLWRALLVRDGGCTWPGCDAPAAWCDVAHGHTPFAENGRLMPANAALLCRSHHRRFDLGPWTIHVHGDQVIYLRPTAQPRAGPERAAAYPTLPGMGAPEEDAPAAGRAPPTATSTARAEQPPPLPTRDRAAEGAGGGWATPDGRFVSDLDELR